MFLGDSNVCLWAGMSPEFVAVVRELQTAKAIHPEPSSVLTYLIDGGALDMPLANRPPPSGYKQPHWAPITFRPGRP